LDDEGGIGGCAGRRRRRWLRAPGYRHDAAYSDMVAVGSMVYLIDERRKLWCVEHASPEPRVERRDTTFALQQQGDSRWSNYLVESFSHVLLLGGRPRYDCHRPRAGRGAVRAPNIGSHARRLDRS
jgi:hypothetical protein